MTHYNTLLAAEFLVSKGSLSVLAERVTPNPEVGIHNFDVAQNGVCVYYGRDRGEDDTEFAVFTSRDDFINGIDGEFFYLYTGGQWLVSEGKYWKVLKDEIESMIEDDAQ